MQFLKVNKTVTHVAVARPHYLDMEAEPVSEGIRRIVHFINAVPKCTRRQLMEGLNPSPVQPPKAEGDPGPTEPAEPTAEQTAVISDLHWLIHQGHVIEFANGVLETAKKPVPKPLKPAPPEAAKSGAAAEPGVAGTEAPPDIEVPAGESIHAKAGFGSETPTGTEEHASALPSENAAPAAKQKPKKLKKKLRRVRQREFKAELFPVLSGSETRPVRLFHS
jgi:hypothetical protein